MKSITQVMQNLVKPYIDTKDKAYAANIAPVEVSPAEAAHTAGTQLIYNAVLYDVTADIAINDDLVTEGAGANISAADNVTEQISSQDKAYASNIAPVEVSPAEAAHTAGTQLIYNGVLYDVTADIAIGDTVTTEGAGANISAADKITEQISSQNEALTDLKENLTEKVASGDAYTFRQGKGTLVDMSLVGGTVAINQIVDFENLGGFNTVITYANGVATLTPSAGNSARARYNLGAVNGHKLIIWGDVKLSNSTDRLRIYIDTGQSSYASMYTSETTDWQRLETVTLANNDTTQIYDIRSETTDAVVQVKNTCVIDLTKMFGTTIADYIYSLEQATAGAGVAFFRKLFPKAYYAYNTGSLQSVKPSGRKVVGFNQWDEQTRLGYYDENGNYNSANNQLCALNYTSILPSTSYYVNRFLPSVAFYDANKNCIIRSNAVNGVFETPDKAYYMRINLGSSYGTSYNNDICINISKTTGSPKNGDYEPYCGIVYPFPSVELRGIPQLVDNKLTYDGDSYKADGSITRKYGIVDLGTLTWTLEGTRFRSSSIATLIKSVSTWNGAKSINAKYKNDTVSAGDTNDKVLGIYEAVLYIRDSSYTDAATFTTAMSGVYLVYELATPTTESASPFINPERSYLDGTEEWIEDGTRDVVVPVGNNSEYYQNETYSPLAESSDSVYGVLENKKVSTTDLKTVVAASSDFSDFKTRIAAL